MIDADKLNELFRELYPDPNDHIVTTPDGYVIEFTAPIEDKRTDMVIGREVVTTLALGKTIHIAYYALLWERSTRKWANVDPLSIPF